MLGKSDKKIKTTNIPPFLWQGEREMTNWRAPNFAEIFHSNNNPKHLMGNIRSIRNPIKQANINQKVTYEAAMA